MTEAPTQDELRTIKCVPCEGGVPKLTPDEAAAPNAQLEGWTVLGDPDRITKSWTVKNFVSGMNFFQQVCELAEDEGHHPEITFGWGYADIEIYTHKIQGLHENDFILAAKIDGLS